jgi:thiol-disulfide isomerase/thioredoxin
VAGLWAQRFERPEGGELAMSALLGRRTLVNFWATWCPPCVKELPMLDAFHRAQPPDGWQVVGLAVDGPTPVREFLARSPVAFPVGLAGLDGIDIGRSLGNAAGGLPFTVVFDRAGAVVDRKLGELVQADLDRWAATGGS